MPKRRKLHEITHSSENESFEIFLYFFDTLPRNRNTGNRNSATLVKVVYHTDT